MAAFDSFQVLRSKTKMPIIGLGSWQASDADAISNAVDYALEVGYRHIDTAALYQNEEAIGAVLKKWFDSGKLKRRDVFITTKLPENVVDKVEHHMKLSLKKLQLDYVDLYLIHQPAWVVLKPSDDGTIQRETGADGNPIPDVRSTLEETWKEMEKQVDAGRAKAIGISNFNSKQVERIVRVARIQPSINQVELHAYFQQKELRATCGKHGILMTSWGSLGSYGRPQAMYWNNGHKDDILLENPTVTSIAKKHGKTAAQVLLRHLAQQGIFVIPKSVTKSRIHENFQIFDFELTTDEMAKLNGLDKGYDGRSYDFLFYPGAELHPEFPMLDVLERLKKK